MIRWQFICRGSIADADVNAARNILTASDQPADVRDDPWVQQGSTWGIASPTLASRQAKLLFIGKDSTKTDNAWAV
jgi:hypothetical protein